MQSIILFIQRFIHIYEFSVLCAVCSVGTVAVYRIDRIEQPCALNENHCWANCAFCAKINPNINGWKSLFSSSYSAALVWQVHCSLHKTYWNTLHRIALLCFALCCTAMEYYVHTEREKNDNSNRESVWYDSNEQQNCLLYEGPPWSFYQNKQKKHTAMRKKTERERKNVRTKQHKVTE